MIRHLFGGISAFAAIISLSQQTFGEKVEDDFFQNLIPEISCSTIAVIKNEEPTGFKYSEYQTTMCSSFQSQFLAANRQIAEQAKKLPRDTEGFFIDWSKVTGHLCKEIIIGNKLNHDEYGCQFGVPSKGQTIASSMYRLYLNGDLPDNYNEGSWCFGQSLAGADKRKRHALIQVFGQNGGKKEWDILTTNLLKEGFHLWQEDGSYYRGFAIASDEGEEDWLALPTPVFVVSFGQETKPQTGELCKDSDPTCNITPRIIKSKEPDSICMEWRGIGP